MWTKTLGFGPRMAKVSEASFDVSYVSSPDRFQWWLTQGSDWAEPISNVWQISGGPAKVTTAANKTTAAKPIAKRRGIADRVGMNGCSWHLGLHALVYGDAGGTEVVTSRNGASAIHPLGWSRVAPSGAKRKCAHNSRRSTSNPASPP